MEEVNPLAAMGLTVDEVIAEDQKLTSQTRKGKRDRSICMCGHAIARHNEYSGLITCKPSAMMCPCKKVKPVLEADDIRPFLRKTEGSGAMHALTRGIAAAVSTGKNVKWLVELKCDRCGKASNDGRVIVPAAVTQSGRLSQSPTGFDALLCDECRVGM